MDFYGRQSAVFKVNLHAHSTMSDGLFTPQQVIDLYAEQKYDALAFTDHRTTNPISTYDNRGMTLLSGIELHPEGPRGILWHLLALGVPEGFPAAYQSGQAAVNAVNAVGGLVFAAHPYWCGFTSAEVMSLREIAGIEVYNTSTRYIGKEYNMQLWDEILDGGRKLPAIAVDDGHRLCDFFRGWTMVCADDKTPAGLLAALKSGSFYATTGPEFHRLSLVDRIFEAEFSPATAAILVCNRSAGYCETVEDERYPGSGKREITRMRVDLSQWEAGNYLRCQITAADGRMAWSNPVWLE